MDPITVLGVISSSIQVAQFIGSTIQGLNTLKGKFKDADTTIRLLIGQLSTIKAAIFQIRDWAEYNFDDSPKEKQFLLGLNVALDGCQAAMDVLSEEVKDLMVGTELHGGGIPASLGVMGKVKAIWNESSMKAHQDRLSGQVQALQLLLLAGQCRDAVSQAKLLGMRENQLLIQKVADDTRTLRESHSSVASQGTRSRSTGGTIFEFDQRLVETRPYQAAAKRPSNIPNNIQERGVVPKRIGSVSSRDDEGYETGSPRSEQRSGDSLRRPSTGSTVDMRPFMSFRNVAPGMNSEGIRRSQSTASSATSELFEPAAHRWAPTSPADSSAVGDKVSDLPKKKFWQSKLVRLNSLTRSTTSTNSSASSFASAQRVRRNHNSNINQSIDFSSTDGLDTPALVKIAQAGNRLEIRRLLENGEDIEACHAATQRTALAVAAHCGVSEVVDILIQHHAKLDCRDVDQSTPLHLAASRGHCGALSLLLNENVNVEAINKHNQTPLWIAADCGHVKATEMLLRRGAKINSRANNQLTALHAATKQGDREMIELLIRNNAHVDSRDGNSMAAIHHACERGHHSIAEYLLQKGASIEAPGNKSMTPLICAAASGHLPVVELLLKKKASTRSLDEEKSSALHLAASNGHLEVVEYLLANKMSIHDRNANGLTPLHLAVLGSHFAIVDFLLQKRASVESACRQGQRPLHYACSSHNPDIIRLLISAGAQPEALVSDVGRRPIHIAAANGSVEAVEVLHQKGVDLSVRDSVGDRPLCIASHYGHMNVVEKLLEYGEPLCMPFKNRPNEDSPICIATKAGHLDVVQLLVSKGASVKQRDEYGYIPLRYAAFHGHPEVLKLLLDKGAELVDNGEDSNGWGFVLQPDMIGFSDMDNISDARKCGVRELLDEAQKKRRNDIDSVFGRRVELDGGELQNIPFRSASGVELPGSVYRGIELSAGEPSSAGQVSPTDPSLSPKAKYSSGSLQEKRQEAETLAPQGTTAAQTRGSVSSETRSPAVSPPTSPHAQPVLTPYEAAQRIANIHAELARLEQYLPPSEMTAGQSNDYVLHEDIYELD